MVNDDETLDLLAGDWKLLQLRAGHRFSTDDLVCAWLGVQAAPDATRLLDLGAGVGTVGLLALWCLSQGGRSPSLVMVEAQEISHQLARRSVALNGLEDRVTSRLGDLRDPHSVPERAAFDLITGSPPYFPLGDGIVSPHPQRAACRFELRGDVFDYCRVAAAALAPAGRFSLVHAAGDPRPEQAIEAAGLVLLSRRDVDFRRGRAPTIAVFIAGHDGQRADPPPLVVREADGQWTPEWQALRLGMGAPQPQRPA